MKQFIFGFAGNPHSLVFFRVATALLSAFSLVAIWPDFQQFYGATAFVDPDLLQVGHASLSFGVHQVMAYLQELAGLTLKTSQTVIGTLYLSLCALLLLGLFTRVSAILLLLLHGSLFTAVPQFSYGVDYFCSMALFYCALFPSGYYGSIDRVLFRLSPSPWLGPCLRLLQLHLCLIYFFSGFDKALGHTWRNGEALWKTLHLPYFRSYFTNVVDGLAPYPWLFVVLGWGVMLCELLYSIFIWWEPTRKLQLGLILALHISIALLLRLYLFSAMMTAWNIAAFCFQSSANERFTAIGTHLPNRQKHRLANR